MLCITPTCDKRATLQEENNSNHVFCSAKCQQKFWTQPELIEGRKRTLDKCPTTREWQEGETVTVSVGGEEFELCVTTALKSGTLRNLIDDFGIDEIIHMPDEITAEMFKQLLQFLQTNAIPTNWSNGTLLKLLDVMDYLDIQDGVPVIVEELSRRPTSLKYIRNNHLSFFEVRLSFMGERLERFQFTKEVSEKQRDAAMSGWIAFALRVIQASTNPNLYQVPDLSNVEPTELLRADKTSVLHYLIKVGFFATESDPWFANLRELIQVILRDSRFPARLAVAYGLQYVEEVIAGERIDELSEQQTREMIEVLYDASSRKAIKVFIEAKYGGPEFVFSELSEYESDYRYFSSAGNWFVLLKHPKTPHSIVLDVWCRTFFYNIGKEEHIRDYIAGLGISPTILAQGYVQCLEYRLEKMYGDVPYDRLEEFLKLPGFDAAMALSKVSDMDGEMFDMMDGSSVFYMFSNLIRQANK